MCALPKKTTKAATATITSIKYNMPKNIVTSFYRKDIGKCGNVKINFTKALTEKHIKIAFVKFV